MDYDDYMDYGNDDHYHDNDDELYHLAFAGCHVVVMYVIKYIDNKPYRNS
jgi:hypothetical protein